MLDLSSISLRNFSVVSLILSFARSISFPPVYKSSATNVFREIPARGEGTRNLLTHGVQSSLQILLQTLGVLSICLLRSWVLGSPATTSLRDRNSGALVETLLTRLNSHMLSESGNLIQNHLAHLADIFHDLEIEVEGCWAARLIRGVVPDLEVRVLKRLFDGDSGGRVKRKHMV